MENMMICHLQRINEDLLMNIMARLDGSALASLASTSTYFRRTAQHYTLWKQLCHSTWPSTSHHLLSPSISRHYNQFFADAYQLILYDDAAQGSSCFPETTPSPSDFVSLVDVYYKNECVLSKVLKGIPETVDPFHDKLVGAHWDLISKECQQWFLNCPFKFQLMDIRDDDEEEAGEDELGHAAVLNGNLDDTNNEERSVSLTFSSAEELMRDLRLSWILLDTKEGKAVNLSSWKPFSVQSLWRNQGNYVVHFGSIIPVEDTLLPGNLTRCIITTKFKVMEGQGKIQCREISLAIENISGALLDGKKSLIVLSKALNSPRSKNQLKVESGFNQYEIHKREMIRRQESREALANLLYITIEIAVFAVLCYASTQLF